MKFEGSDFYAALMHELKNDLGLLSMSLERIPLQGDAIHDATLDAARLHCQDVVDRLHQALLIYRAADHEIHPNVDAYSPLELVERVAARASALAHGRFCIRTAVASDMPALRFFDRDLVEMALLNAIHNALAHARSTIAVEAAVTDGYLELTVRDDSTGYPEHVLASVAEGMPCRATVGTGLGLQFARLIAERHVDRARRGELRLRNDGGAVFCLRLP